MSTTPRPNSQLSDLTLLVERPLALQEEVFLQHGLTLGRAASNAICINHPDVDHIHARVQKQPDGSFALQCEGNASVVSVGAAPTRLRHLALTAGTAFQLGDAIIRCRQQAHASALMRENLWETNCPFCQASLAGQPSDLTVCPECGLTIFLARAGDFTGWLPRQVGPYAVQRYVARGGMGLVLQALDEDGTPVAIKVPNPQVAGNPRWRQRFEREVETLQRLNHPNLIRLLDHGRICKLRWVVMEWVEWGDNDQTLAHWLKAWLDVGQVPPLADLSLILQQIIASLEYLHRMGVIHRDLKPTNVLLSGGGEVKLIDFGLARELDGGDNTSLTQTGATTGTMAYMAPEQWHGGELTPAVDVYALGVLWHELLTGKRPGRRLKLATERADCPPEWVDVLEQCLEDEPDHRPSLANLRSLLFRPPMTRSAAGTDKVEPREHRNGKFEREGVTQLDRNQSRQSKVVGEGLVQKDRRSRDNWGIFWMGSFVVFGIAIIIAAIIHFRVPILFWPIFFGLLATCAEILAKKLISEERLNVHERRLLVWSNRLDIVQQRFIGSNSRGIKYATIFLLLASITMVTLFSLAAFLLMRSGDLSFGVAGVVILLAFLVIFILLKSFRN